MIIKAMFFPAASALFCTSLCTHSVREVMNLILGRYMNLCGKKCCLFVNVAILYRWRYKESGAFLLILRMALIFQYGKNSHSFIPQSLPHLVILVVSCALSLLVTFGIIGLTALLCITAGWGTLATKPSEVFVCTISKCLMWLIMCVNHWSHSYPSCFAH